MSHSRDTDDDAVVEDDDDDDDDDAVVVVVDDDDDDDLRAAAMLQGSAHRKLGALLEIDFESAATTVIDGAAAGAVRSVKMLPELVRLACSHEWSSTDTEYRVLAELVAALDSADSWKRVDLRHKFELLARHLELETHNNPESDFSVFLSRFERDESFASRIAPIVLQALEARSSPEWHDKDFLATIGGLRRLADLVRVPLRPELLLRVAEIEVVHLGEAESAVVTLLVAFSMRFRVAELFERAVGFFHASPPIVARLQTWALASVDDAVERARIRRVFAEVSGDLSRAGIAEAPTTPNLVDLVKDLRFPTSALFYGDLQLREWQSPDAPNAGGAAQLPGTFPADADLVYRFWIDERPGQGVADANPVGLRPPAGTTFPVSLTVRVWSGDVTFANGSAEIELGNAGNSEIASFRFKLKTESEAEILTFVAHGSRLLAVYRVVFTFGGNVFDQVLHVSSAHQEHLFAVTDWFTFPTGKPSGSALTLYLREYRSRLQVLLPTSSTVWAQLVGTSKELEQRAGLIYVEFQRIALEYDKHACDVRGRRMRLAQFGQDLLSAFTLAGPERASDLSRLIGDAKDGTELTILTDRSCAELVVPWGIITQRPADVSRREDFWAARFALFVQPPFHRPRPSARQDDAKIRIATAYANHAECGALHLELEQLGFDLTPLASSDGAPLALLASTAFDVVHFFCHGHGTPDMNHAERSLVEVLSDSRKALATSLEWKFMQGDLATYLRWEQHTLHLSELRQHCPREFAGAPVVVLTACESGVPFAGCLGLVSYFLGAGASAVVATEGPVPWDVSRGFARELMLALQRGEPLARATRDARNSIKNDAELFGLAYSVFGNGHASISQSKQEAS